MHYELNATTISKNGVYYTPREGLLFLNNIINGSDYMSGAKSIIFFNVCVKYLNIYICIFVCIYYMNSVILYIAVPQH